MPQIEAVIVSQYTTIVGALDQMFKEIDLRSNGSFWRWNDSPYAGVGGCKHINKSPSESGLVGSARNILIKLREQKEKEFPGSSSLSPCPYHRENHGCILEELKSPLCIEYVDNPEEIKKRFGIDGSQLTHNIGWMLRYILESKDPHTHMKLESPIQNNDFVHDAHEAITTMTQHIKRFPVLH